MKVQTGKGTIPLLTLIAIWSISLVVNLPGLAISPIMNDLTTIFPGTSQLEIQLLTILPNLFIIPFVLLSGKLSISKNKIKIVIIALAIYLTSAVLYFFAKSMTELIIISALLGVGCGLVIPLAAGLISDFFVGKYRMKQLGIKSAIANFSLVFATVIAGYLAKINWHLPFLVYLIPIIPLALMIFIKPSQEIATISPTHAAKSYNKQNLIWVVSLYALVTYLVISISYYLPFLAATEKISSGSVGAITSLFFLAIMFPGFFLSHITDKLKNHTVILATGTIALGLLMVSVSHTTTLFAIGAIFMGMGYGVIQPIIYNKASIIGSGSKSTLILSYALAVNYVAVTVAPFIIDLFQKVAGTTSERFPFYFNLAISLAAIVVILANRQNFAFTITDDINQ